MFEFLKSTQWNFARVGTTGKKPAAWTLDRNWHRSEAERHLKARNFTEALRHLAVAVEDADRRKAPPKQRVRFRLELADAQRRTAPAEVWRTARNWRQRKPPSAPPSTSPPRHPTAKNTSTAWTRWPTCSPIRRISPRSRKWKSKPSAWALPCPTPTPCEWPSACIAWPWLGTRIGYTRGRRAGARKIDRPARTNLRCGQPGDGDVAV